MQLLQTNRNSSSALSSTLSASFLFNYSANCPSNTIWLEEQFSRNALRYNKWDKQSKLHSVKQRR